MSTLLLNLRNVPEDEAAEVRSLLDQSGIGFYETEPSFWGFSSGAIWLQDASQREEATRLIASYQQERASRMRSLYEEALRLGDADTFWQRVGKHPFRSLALLLVVALILFLTLTPFITLFA